MFVKLAAVLLGLVALGGVSSTNGTLRDENLNNDLQTSHRQRQLRIGSRFNSVVDVVLRRNLNCPPKDFDALKNFNFTSYISKPWFAVKQIPLAYQPLDAFYCVRATYIKDTTRCLFCGSKPRINIFNQARRDSVTGELIGDPYDPNTSTDSGLFIGFQKREKEPAKLTVGFVSRFSLSSNYWVVAAGTYNDALNGLNNPIPSSNDYDYAIISAGTPTKETDNAKCIPAPGIINFYGLWMFARDPVPPAGVIEGIDKIADAMGLDNTQWLPVNQEGCVYN